MKFKLDEAGNSKIKLSTSDLVVTFYNGKPIVEYEFDYLKPNEQFIIFDMITMIMDRFLGRHLADISIMDGGTLIFTPITRQNLEFKDFKFQDGTLLSNQFANEKQFEPIKTNIESYVDAPELSARIAKKFPSKYQAYVPQQFTAGVLIPPKNTQYIKEIIFDIAPANGDKQFRQVISREYTKELPTDLSRTNFLNVLQSNAANKQLKYAIGITNTIDINQAIYFEDVGETPDFIKALHDCKHTAEKSGIYNLLSNITWKTVMLEIPETEAIAKAQKAPVYKRSAGFVKKTRQ